MIHTDICIIGGGAAGTAAAIKARRTAPGAGICIIEKEPRLLKKVQRTGNGRCNISNTNCESHREVEEFFNSIGVVFDVEEEGRAYPYNRKSESVVAALTNALDGTDVVTDCSVTGIKPEDNRFLIETDKEDIDAGLVLISTGGKSGEGYIWARKLGHQVKTMIPVLTGIIPKDDISKLAGVRARASVTLLKKGKEVLTETGEVQFNAGYVSGICIMNLSRYLLISDDTGFNDYELVFDFVPDFEKEEVEKMLAGGAIVSLVDQKLAGFLDDICEWKLTVDGAMGWKYAQVAKGGVVLDEIDEKTMESKLVPGLFFAGEVTDYDGKCGGYNLNNAWRGGLAAGYAMGKRCTDTKD